MRSADYAAEQPDTSHIPSPPKVDEHRPTVVLLPCSEAWTAANSEQQLRSALGKSAVTTEVADEEETLGCLEEELEPTPSAILITQGELSASKGAAQRLADFAYAGGRVTYAFLSPLYHNSFGSLLHEWRLSWTTGAYHRTTFALGPNKRPHPLSISVHHRSPRRLDHGNPKSLYGWSDVLICRGGSVY